MSWQVWLVKYRFWNRVSWCVVMSAMVAKFKIDPCLETFRFLSTHVERDDQGFLWNFMASIYMWLSNKIRVQTWVILQKIIFKANPTLQTYIGLTENSFKTRFTSHKASFNNPSKRIKTKLSKHIWKLRNAKTTWNILNQATPYNPASKQCDLCLWEKYFIICRPDLATLNWLYPVDMQTNSCSKISKLSRNSNYLFYFNFHCHAYFKAFIVLKQKPL